MSANLPGAPASGPDEAPPAGFVLLPPLDAVMVAIGPLFVREDPMHRTLGFRVAGNHTNETGVCHGGVWATFADLLIGLNSVRWTQRSGPTVSLSIDFLGAAHVGAWVEGRTELLRRTRNLAFLQCTATADGEIMLRGSAIFRLQRDARPGLGEA